MSDHSASDKTHRYAEGIGRRLRLLDPAANGDRLTRVERDLTHVHETVGGLSQTVSEMAAALLRVEQLVNQQAASLAIYDRLGFHLLLDKAATIDSSIIGGHAWEAQQVDVMSRAIRGLVRRHEDVRFLDLGSYWGYYSLIAADNGIEVIHAFEPERQNRAQLCTQLLLNGITDRVTVHSVALDATAGKVEFRDSRFHPEHNRGGSGIVRTPMPNMPTYEVSTVALDEYLPISGATLVMKLDLEGAESQALRGMRKTIENNKVLMQVEVFPQHHDEIMDEISSLPLRQIHAIEPDVYFTNLPEQDLAWLG